MTRASTSPPLRLLERFTNSTPAPATTTTANNVGPPVPKPSANNKRPTPIIIYPTVTPESIVVPIVSCIFGFPLLALTVICCLRRRAKMARFFRKYRLPGVLACVDGTHVAIVTPNEHEERYKNRKGYHSMNVMIMCDSNLNILCVDASYPGSTHDSVVWANHYLNAYLDRLHRVEGEDVYLLGDSGYPLRVTMMIPITNPSPGTPEEYYQNLHLSARSVVERCIGVLKARFRERARRRNCELDRGELSVVKMSPVRSKPRAVSLIRSPRPPPTLELDTVLEERSDPEQTTLSQVEITPDREVGTILFGAVGAMGTAAAAAVCNRDS